MVKKSYMYALHGGRDGPAWKRHVRGKRHVRWRELRERGRVEGVAHSPRARLVAR